MKESMFGSVARIPPAFTFGLSLSLSFKQIVFLDATSFQSKN